MGALVTRYTFLRDGSHSGFLNAGSVEDIGEDEQSIEEHMKAMSTKMDKSRPNIDQIKSRMRRTLHARTDLYKNKAEVLQQCPFLKVPRLLLHEMELRFGQDVDANLTGFLHSSAGRIVESTKGPLHASLTAAIAEADPLKAKDLLSNAGVLLLPTLMKENSKLLYCINKVSRLTGS
ncbi:hypothetical protein SKAU_G00066110 [Synaphobranchus kaupii]|uniref:Uncharacterized protein n=1 Tax=Synaphobranchus kaupii TaxID=118154 RepID=A0A9Q1G6A6_SYNKA|nr:hypothetical protein SKAU_G00066110 [Synaphobranchus kaupii]